MIINEPKQDSVNKNYNSISHQKEVLTKVSKDVRKVKKHGLLKILPTYGDLGGLWGD